MRDFHGSIGEAALRTGKARPVPPAGTSLPSASYPSQPRPGAQEITFGHLTRE